MAKSKLRIKPAKVKSTYARPWSKLADPGGVQLPVTTLNVIGRTIVKEIRREILKDIAKSKSIAGTANLPDTPQFYDSFSYRVSPTGKSIEIRTTWPWMNVVMEGTDGPFKMEWLTQQRGGPKIVPLKGDDGTVIFRTTPILARDAWIHPGVAKYNFFRRAIESARKKIQPEIKRVVVDLLSKSDPSR